MARATSPLFLNSPLSVTYSDRPIPTLASPRDVLVAIAFTGICGSDVHYWQHGAIGSFILKSPMCLGHESSGTIAAVGSAVTSLKVGDRVAIEPGTPCRHCEPCLGGHYNLCADMRFAATPPYDGTLTGFYSAPDDFCYKLPEHMSLQEGAVVEPLAVAVHIAKQAQISPGASVVVMGAGPVGLLCCAVARAFGASKVVSVDIQQARLDFAKGYAATHTFMPERVAAEVNAAALIAAADLGEGADAVIDASGAEPSIQTSIHVVRRGGVYVQGGMGKTDITFPIMAMCTKEITMRGSFRYGSGDYKLAVQLVAGGTVEVKSLVSREVAFSEAERAFEDVLKGKGIKVLIRGPNHEGDEKAAVSEKSEVVEKPEEVAAPEKVEKTDTTEAVENSEPAAETAEVKTTEMTSPAPATEQSAPTEIAAPAGPSTVSTQTEPTEPPVATEQTDSVPTPTEVIAPAGPAAVTAPAEPTEKTAPAELTDSVPVPAEKEKSDAVDVRTSVADAIHKIEGSAKGLETLG